MHICHFPYLGIGQPSVYLSAFWNELALAVICLEHFRTQKQSVSLGELYNVRDCHSSDSAPGDSAASKGIRQVMTLRIICCLSRD